MTKFSELLAKHTPEEITRFGSYFTVVGYACFNGWMVSEALGQKPDKILKERGLELSIMMSRGQLTDWIVDRLTEYAKNNFGGSKTKLPSRARVKQMVFLLNKIHSKYITGGYKTSETAYKAAVKKLAEMNL